MQRNKVITAEEAMILIQEGWTIGIECFVGTGTRGINRIAHEGMFKRVISGHYGLDEHNFSLVQGSRTWGPDSVGWSLYDYFAYQNVYQTCAGLAPSNSGAYVANLHVLDPN